MFVGWLFNFPQGYVLSCITWHLRKADSQAGLLQSEFISVVSSYLFGTNFQAYLYFY